MAVDTKNAYFTPSQERAAFYQDVRQKINRKDRLAGVRDHYDAIVIGGGLAGLTCANALAKSGHPAEVVVLFEQQHRMPAFGQCISTGQPRQPAADHDRIIMIPHTGQPVLAIDLLSDISVEGLPLLRGSEVLAIDIYCHIAST